MSTLGPILHAVARVRLRMRLQTGLEWGANTAGVGLLLALLFALAGRLEWLAAGAALPGVIVGLALGPLGFLAGLARPISPLVVAKQIDMSHALKDQLSSALDFAARSDAGAFEEITIREACKVASQVKPGLAAPFSLPKNLGTSLALGVVLGVLVALQFPPEEVPAPPASVASLQPLTVNAFDLEREKAKAQELLDQAKEANDKELQKVAEKLLALWEAVERGEITQEEALKQLAALEQELGDGQEAKQKSLSAEAAELAKALEKNKNTKALAEALAKGDLDKAAEELERLAENADKLSPQEREQLKEALEKAADLAEKRELERENEELSPEEKEAREQEEEEEKKRELDRCAAFEADDPERPEECKDKFSEEELEERRRELQKDEREIERLRRESKEKQEKKEKEREREQLSRDLRKLAEQLEKSMTEEQKKALREAAKKAAEEMKKRGEQQRQAGRSQKAKGKLSDAKDVIIRSGSSKGRGKAEDFRGRASGKRPGQQPGQGQGQGEGQDGQGQQPGKGKGQGKEVYEIDPENPGQGDAMVMLPGMGQPGGQGQDGQGGEGQDGQGQGGEGKGGDQFGEGSADALGEETSLSGASFNDVFVPGQAGNGPSAVEVIGRASQQGLAGAKYQKVYRQAQKEAEESLEREKIPVGYKRFVKRYFDLIQPQ